MAHAKLQEAIVAAGFTPIIVVGFGDKDGEFAFKIATIPAMRELSDETWEMIEETITRSLRRLKTLPLDDLELGY
jgi:hypothetical protein